MLRHHPTVKCPASSRQQGFTLFEALMAIGMGTIFLVSAISTLVYQTKVWKSEGLRSELRYNMEKSLQKINNDFRLSDGGKILFYPTGSSSYTAVSLPREYANPNTGLYDFSTAISWQDTVAYYVYNNELRRSTIAYNSSSATRQTQLNSLASTGTLNGATTVKMFGADAVSIALTPTAPTFDGYASSLTKSSNTSFGSAILTPGNHTVRFEVTGKNSSSSNYRIGLDSIALTPSGNDREAEGLTVSSDSGKSKTVEDMSLYPSSGAWGGNSQLEYASSSIGDQITFQVYNDEWIESNFADVTFTYSEVTGTNPVLTVASRENQGLSPAWRADSQTGAVESDNTNTLSDISCRNIIQGSSFVNPITMVRFKFKAPASGGVGLHISAAYFGQRSGGTSNFAASPAPVQLYFGNATVAAGGSDGVGATGSTGAASIDIPVGSYVWSNWVIFPIATPTSLEYLLSFSVSGTQPSKETYWEPGSGTNSYMVNGQRADAIWAPSDSGYETASSIQAVSEMASWYHVGSVVSQVFDTKMTSPAYSNVSWTTNGSGSYLVKVRSANNVQMTGASDWTSLGGTSAPGAISGAGNGRYVQWQTTLTTASPYSAYPQLDNLSVQWPGQTTLVELSGYYTKRPNYGTFKVQLDGVDIVNALQLDLSASKTQQGKTETYTVSVETKTKNTGK